MIKYETIFTKEQLVHIIDLWCKSKGPPNKEILAYINTLPEVLRACEAQKIYPPYLAYLLEYQLNCEDETFEEFYSRCFKAE